MPEDVVIHIVDDEEPVRKSLAFLLTMSGHVARVHDSASAFLQAASGLRNACLITDLRMPDMSGVELLRQLVQEGNLLPTIVITGHGDVPMAVEAMKAGALDLIEKPFSDEVLLDAVSRAIQQLETRPQADADASIVRERVSLLTEREQQVMHRIVAGLPNKTIAFELDISPRTVEVHRANVMTKMQARNLPELVRMALLADNAAR